MEKIIEEQVAGRRPEEVEELSIDNCQVSQISGLSDTYTNLETLSLMNNELTSLKGFPKLSNLRKLDLSDNKLSEGLELLSASENIEFLILSGNPLKDVSSLEPLKKLKQLQSLEVMNCPLAEKEEYRKQIFELLEEVLFVDGVDRAGRAVPNDDDDDDDEDSEAGDEVESDDGALGPEAADEEEESEDDGDEAPRGTKRKHDEEEDA